MDKQFTIVVCTYNGQRFLEKCLNAILNLNSLEKFVDQVYVVDNNSNDNTKNIIMEYTNKNKIIKYEFEKKQGLSFARKHAVKANTRWVIYVDDDNILDKNWLIELMKEINNNKNIGIINGAVIAKPEEELNATEKSILEVFFRNLACTHLIEPKTTDRINKTPMGAGLCVRTAALRVIDDNGWLSLKGRTKSKLSSGEDSELCDKILNQGYTYSCNYKMKLYHIIPKKRLEKEYIVNLINGLVERKNS